MEKPKVTLRSQVGFSQLASAKEWTLMNTEERIAFEKELGLDAGQDYDLLRFRRKSAQIIRGQDHVSHSQF